jgi:hypothetical protein
MSTAIEAALTKVESLLSAAPAKKKAAKKKAVAKKPALRPKPSMSKHAKKKAPAKAAPKSGGLSSRGKRCAVGYRKDAKGKCAPKKGGGYSKMQEANKRNRAWGKKVSASADVWERAYRIVASFESLKRLQRQVERGILSQDDVIGAVGDALRKKHVSQHLVDAVLAVLQDAFAIDMFDDATAGDGDVIDLEPVSDF